jgi:hypothetical protein
MSDFSRRSDAQGNRFILREQGCMALWSRCILEAGGWLYLLGKSNIVSYFLMVLIGIFTVPSKRSL